MWCNKNIWNKILLLDIILGILLKNKFAHIYNFYYKKHQNKGEKIWPIIKIFPKDTINWNLLHVIIKLSRE